MGLTRLGTLALHIFLLAFTYSNYILAREHAGALVFNILLIVLDFYFCLVIFSYYRTTPQEELDIEM